MIVNSISFVVSSTVDVMSIFAILVVSIRRLLHVNDSLSLIITNVAKRHPDNSRHFKLLNKAQLRVKAFRGIIFMSNYDKRLVAALDDETREILSQIYSVAGRK